MENDNLKAQQLAFFNEIFNLYILRDDNKIRTHLESAKSAPFKI